MRPHSEVGTPRRGRFSQGQREPACWPQWRQFPDPRGHVAGDAGRPRKPTNRGFGCQAHRTRPGGPPPGGRWEPRGRKLQAQHRRPLEPGPSGPSHLPKPGSIQSGPGLGLSMDSQAWIKSTSGLVRGGLPEGQAAPPWPPARPRATSSKRHPSPPPAANTSCHPRGSQGQGPCVPPAGRQARGDRPG